MPVPSESTQKKNHLAKKGEHDMNVIKNEKQRAGSLPGILRTIPVLWGWLNWCFTLTDEERIEAGISIGTSLDQEKYKRVYGDYPE